MGNLVNNVDPDEMPQHAAFHQGLHCLLRQNNIQALKSLKSLICTMCTESLYQSRWNSSLVYKGLNLELG